MIPLAEQSLEQRVKELEAEIKLKGRRKTLNYCNGGHKGILVKFDVDTAKVDGLTWCAMNFYGCAFTAGNFNTTLSFSTAENGNAYGDTDQANTAGNIPTCSVGKVDGKIAVWIPFMRTYSTFAVETSYWLNDSFNGINEHTAESLKEKPVMSNEKTFTIST